MGKHPNCTMDEEEAKSFRTISKKIKPQHVACRWSK
jgi:hypothetical protein